MIDKKDKMYISILDNIRNFRKLDAHQLEYIQQLGENNKMEIIYEFNNSFEAINQLFK